MAGEQSRGRVERGGMYHPGAPALERLFRAQKVGSGSSTSCGSSAGPAMQP